MREFLEKYWLYLLVGFLTIFLAVLALVTVLKLRQVQPIAPTVPQTIPQAAAPPPASPTPTLEVKDNYAQLSFSLASAEANQLPECTGLSASPSEGTAPLSVKFTASGADSDGKIVAFEFTFGDGAGQTVEKDPVSARGVETQDISHTYNQAGNYTASVRVTDNNQAVSTVPETCKVTVAVTGSLGAPEETTPEATETAIPLPELPESGGFLPTILTILGGGIIVLLGIIL